MGGCAARKALEKVVKRKCIDDRGSRSGRIEPRRLLVALPIRVGLGQCHAMLFACLVLFEVLLLLEAERANVAPVLEFASEEVLFAYLNFL